MNKKKKLRVQISLPSTKMYTVDWIGCKKASCFNELKVINLASSLDIDGDVSSTKGVE